MSSGPSQHQRAPTARVAASLGTERTCGSSSAAEKHLGAGTMSSQQRLFYSEKPMDLIKETNERLIKMKMALQFKEHELADCESLLEERDSRMSHLSTEMCHTKSALEDEVRLREAAERRIADMESREYSSYDAFQDMLKKLNGCYEADAALLEEMGGLKETNARLSNCLGETKKKLKDVQATMVSLRRTWRKENSCLTAELENCRVEVDRQAHLYEDAQASNQKLENYINDMQLQIEALTTDNAQCHQKMQCLVEEHSNVLEHNKNFACQLAAEKEQNEQFIAQLQKLASKVCDPSRLDDGSVPGIFEALASALQQLTQECRSLRESERVVRSNNEALTGERDALMAENRALAEKQRGYDELQEAKERLENDLGIQTNVANSMMREIQGDLSSVKDSLSQVIRETMEAHCPFEDALQSAVTEALQQRTRIRLFLGHWSRFQSMISDMSDELAKEKEEVRRLSAQCAGMDSIIRDQRAEIQGLCNGITNFEQLAADCAADLSLKEAECAALRESLAAVQMEAVPVEEREKAALLLLEKETQITRLERELQQEKEEVASLTREKKSAMNEAEMVREANRSLKGAMCSLSEELQREQNRRENMDDCTAQTEEIAKNEYAMQTELTAKDDCAAQTEQPGKADQGVQVACGDEIMAELKTSQREVDVLNAAMGRICLENEALIKSNREHGSQLNAMENTCHALEEQVKKLNEELKGNKKDKEALQKKICCLEATLASTTTEAQKLSKGNDQASTRLKAENVQLKAEVLKLQKDIRNLKSEVITTKDAEAVNHERLEQLLQDAKDEIKFLKRVGSTASSGMTTGHKASTPVQTGHKSVSVALQDVPKDMPKREGPSSLHIPSLHPSTPAQALSSISPVPADAPSSSMLRDKSDVRGPAPGQEPLFTPESPCTSPGLRVAPMVAEPPGTNTSSGESLSELIKICEAVPVKPKPPSTDTLQGAKGTGGSTRPTKFRAAATTKASKQQQETKPQAKVSPRKGKRTGLASATTALSGKSTELEKKADSSSTSEVPAPAPAPKKRKFFKKMESPVWEGFFD